MKLKLTLETSFGRLVIGPAVRRCYQPLAIRATVDGATVTGLSFLMEVRGRSPMHRLEAFSAGFLSTRYALAAAGAFYLLTLVVC